MDCRVKPGNDGFVVIARSEATTQYRPRARLLDCFAQPVIGRRFAQPVGSQ
jgi:hypothetical protein